MPLDAYQQRARECLQMAGRAASEEDRTTWRELALCWLRLSAHEGVKELGFWCMLLDPVQGVHWPNL
jgi:hypothetical protein